MLTLCICYTIDLHKTSDFEQYARRWPEPIRRCGGDLLGYFLPTKFAGPTNVAYALIRFKNLTAYEQYREALSKDPDARRPVFPPTRPRLTQLVSDGILAGSGLGGSPGSGREPLQRFISVRSPGCGEFSAASWSAWTPPPVLGMSLRNVSAIGRWLLAAPYAKRLVGRRMMP